MRAHSPLNQHPHHQHLSLRNRLFRIGIGAGVGAVLVLAFLAYLRPSFVMDLANRIVLCF